MSANCCFYCEEKVGVDDTVYISSKPICPSCIADAHCNHCEEPIEDEDQMVIFGFGFYHRKCLEWSRRDAARIDAADNAYEEMRLERDK